MEIVGLLLVSAVIFYEKLKYRNKAQNQIDERMIGMRSTFLVLGFAFLLLGVTGEFHALHFGNKSYVTLDEALDIMLRN